MVTFRTDDKTDQILAALTADGTSVSEAIRRALADVERQRRRARMREDALRLRDDPDDREEARRILEEMDELRGR